MSNYHLRDRPILLKAKGLLSQMLSLPPEWDYTLQGLAYINKEEINSVREGVKELEKAGYIKRRRVRLFSFSRWAEDCVRLMIRSLL